MTDLFEKGQWKHILYAGMACCLGGIVLLHCVFSFLSSYLLQVYPKGQFTHVVGNTSSNLFKKNLATQAINQCKSLTAF